MKCEAFILYDAPCSLYALEVPREGNTSIVDCLTEPLKL